MNRLILESINLKSTATMNNYLGQGSRASDEPFPFHMGLTKRKLPLICTLAGMTTRERH
jgi:hypothetical protein